MNPIEKRPESLQYPQWHASGRVAIMLAVTFALSFVGASDAAASRIRRCRRACQVLVAECQPSRPRGICRRAKRTVLAHCREEGESYCARDWGPTKNRCNAAWAEDHRGEGSLIVLFEPVFGDFSPECVRVSPETAVTFAVLPKLIELGVDDDFSDFPLIGGEVGTFDPTSPFNPPTTTGKEVTFVMTEPGIFPYHAGDSEARIGAVIVER